MKKINYYIIGFVLIFFAIKEVDASASLNVSNTSVYVDDTFTTTVNLSNVASWEVHVYSNGPVKNCSIDQSDSTENAANGSKSYSVTCTATSTGNITLTLSGNTTGESDDSATTISDKKIVTVLERPQSTGEGNSAQNNNNPKVDNTKVKSSNNSLSDLSVEGATLSPEFDSGTTEYSVSVKEGTESVNISAIAEDSSATINGTGTFKVSEGLNVKKIIVTAENGYEKTYTLNINVEDDPIVIQIDQKDNSIVKKQDTLPRVSSYYSYTSINYKYKIDGEEKELEIPAYYSEITGYTLVGLKDENGDINLYIYDDENNSFNIYRELSFNNILLYQMDAENLPDGYNKTKIKINDEEVIVYQKNENSEFYLIYGMNVDTGKKGWYHYDSKDMTIQRYDAYEINELEKTNDRYILTIYVLGCVCIIFTIFCSVATIKNKRKNIIE